MFNFTFNISFSVITIVLMAVVGLAAACASMLYVSVDSLRNLSNWALSRAAALDAYHKVYQEMRISHGKTGTFT